MSMMVYLALFASLAVGLRYGPGRVLLWVYLPVLLLIPDSFRATTPGLPDPTFGQAAMIPLVVFAIIRYGHSWRPRLVDLLVLMYASVVAWSDFSARGYSDAQNLMFGMLFSVLGPYIVARLVVGAEDLHIALARRIVVLLFIVALVGFYEARFGANPFHAIFRPFFPGQGTGWVTTFRHGLARTAGPYSHAILAGIMMFIAYRLQRWLQWGGHWESRFRYPVALPWDEAKVISVVLLLGTLMTLARGPWIGAVVAASIVMVGRARNRQRALYVAISGVLVGGLSGMVLLANYLEVAPGAVMTMSQESAMYRKVLFEEYLSIAVDRAWFGWGLTTWPKVPGMPSIDNHWLLLALMHGVLAMTLLAGILLLSAAQLILHGMREPHHNMSPAFTLAGIFAGVVVAICTVYMGEQVVPMVFLLLGWGQCLLTGSYKRVSATLPPVIPDSHVAASPFRSVIS